MAKSTEWKNLKKDERKINLMDSFDSCIDIARCPIHSKALCVLYRGLPEKEQKSIAELIKYGSQKHLIRVLRVVVGDEDISVGMSWKNPVVDALFVQIVTEFDDLIELIAKGSSPPEIETLCKSL